MKWAALVCAVLVGGFWSWSPAQDQRYSVAGEASGLRFSGYEWRIKTSGGNVGPGPNQFGANAVEVDQRGFLHLRILHYGRKWICGEVYSRRSFGFGEYHFIVQNAARLDVNAVVGLFIWDSSAAQKFFREADIEISRWGDPKNPNGQWVIQPFVRPGNRVRFELPPTRLELSFRWSPGKLLFRAAAGATLLHEHLFTKGVPDPDQENVHLNIWMNNARAPADGKTEEVVVESFTYLGLEERRKP